MAQTPPPPPPPPPSSAPPPPPTGPGYSGQQTDGTAIGALVCAIAAWVICPIILAVVALVLARNSEQKIQESGGQLTGEGLNKAARIVAWINIVFNVILLVVIIVVVILAAVFGDDDTNDIDNDFDSIRVAGSYLFARLGLLVR